MFMTCLISQGGGRNQKLQDGTFALREGDQCLASILPAQNSWEQGGGGKEKGEGERRGDDGGAEQERRKQVSSHCLLEEIPASWSPEAHHSPNLGKALTSFARVLVIYRLRFVLFVPIKTVIIIEASADPQLPGENNTRDHQPQEHPRGECLQTHPSPLEEKEGTRPGGQRGCAGL